MRIGPIFLVFAISWPACGAIAANPDEAPLRAAASAVDISPVTLPCIVNGGFLQATSDRVRDRLYARCLVLDDGQTKLAICVVDSCMMPRELIDKAKAIASERTGIPTDRMLVSATHTHTAPSAMGALGTPPDAAYVEFLPGKIAEAIEKAAAERKPAKVGWAVVEDWEHTHCRRWIRRPDRILNDPFGKPTARANMHPGYESPDVIGPAGPVDPGLSVLSVQSAEGEPIAVLANYSMHYFGTEAVSADYYGRFAERMAKLLDAGPSFVAMMSQGTSGDQHWMDYGRPKSDITIDQYADAVARKALEAYQSIAYRDRVPLAMAEATLTLGRRVPDAERLAWARPIVEAMGDRPPRDLPEVYAKEAVFLHDEPTRELKLQAIRIGDLGIAAIPDEVYAITGLKVKAMSPLETSFTMELANGSEGYIPPPEQHALGGYTTWPARTAGLEVQAEPKIVEAVLGLLEKVSGKPRREPAEPGGAYAEAVLASKPLAYWRLGELSGAKARDATGRGHDADHEPGIALGMPGPRSEAFGGKGAVNRGIHCAGGRTHARLDDLGETYSIEFWFWNGLPNDARPITGYLTARGPEGPSDFRGDRLGIDGNRSPDGSGRLIVLLGQTEGGERVGKTPVAPRSWHHVALVREGESVALYLDGREEIASRHAGSRPSGSPDLFFGGASARDAGLEGKLDEVSVYDRALKAEEVSAHYEASGRAAGPDGP
jgi:hypothetical protein